MFNYKFINVGRMNLQIAYRLHINAVQQISDSCLESRRLAFLVIIFGDSIFESVYVFEYKA